MNKKIFVVSLLALTMLLGSFGCAKHSETVYYQEWDVAWLTPVGTSFDVVGELYKPIKQDRNKQIGVFVSETDGRPTIVQYPILQKNIAGRWIVVNNGYDRDMMMSEYDLLADRPYSER